MGLVSSIVVATEEDEIVWIKSEDPEMLNAIKKARASLDEFLAIAKTPKEGMSDFVLKVRLGDTKGHEHFWVMPFEENQNSITGYLANKPKVIEGYSLGQKITFDQSMISDWGYSYEGKKYGNFTTCVLFQSMPEEQAKYYRENYGFQC